MTGKQNRGQEGRMVRRAAFTFAEVLITLAIIGVVAVIILPMIIETYKKQVTVAKLKKAYIELNQLVKRSADEHQDFYFWKDYPVEDLDEWVKTYILPYYKSAKMKKCGTNQCARMKVLGGNPFAGGSSVGIEVKTLDYNLYFTRYGSVYSNTIRIRVLLDPAYKERNTTILALGKNTFTFIIDLTEKTPVVRPYGYGIHPYGKYDGKSNTSRDTLLGTMWGGCKKGASGSGYWGPGDACSSVIMLDEWKIKKGYPW